MLITGKLYESAHKDNEKTKRKKCVGVVASGDMAVSAYPINHFHFKFNRPLKIFFFFKR